MRIITLFGNSPGVPEFHDRTIRWDENTRGAKWNWTKSLQPGDVVQLVPRASFPAWINFVRSARITIAYEPIVETPVPKNAISTISRIYSRPLNSAAKEVRLLELQPGALEDPLVCTVHSYTLGSGHDFEALSYCWGDAYDYSDLVLHLSSTESLSQTIQISRSAFVAMQQLRYRDKPRTIWIDQVCINQGDLEERAQQVSIMAEVYSDASAVNIWLGERDVNTEAGLRVVRDIHNFNTRVCKGDTACHCAGTRHLVRPDSIDEYLKRTGKSLSFKGMYQVFKVYERGSFLPSEVIDSVGGVGNLRLSELMSCLFRNPWFQRVWVLQEALRARKALVYCGPERITWDELLDVNTWLHSNAYRLQEAFLPPHPMMPSIWMQLKTREYDAGHSATPVISTASINHLNILDVFLAGLELKATDPRDKLFALLSFGSDTCKADDLPLTIKPSYLKSPNRVLADFTRWWIRTNKSLDILSKIHGQPGRTWVRLYHTSVQPKIAQPTWAIGCDGNGAWAETTLTSLFDFKASKDTIPFGDFLDQDAASSPELLDLKGFELGRISEITYPTLEDGAVQQSDSSKEILNVLDRIIDPSGSHTRWNSKPRKEVEAEVVHRLFKDPAGLKDHLHAHWGYTSQPKFSALRSGARMSHDFDNYGFIRCETDTIPTCLDPFYFTTLDGGTGICPWAARTGDVVVILYGGKVPYLLRQLEAFTDDEDTGESAGRFEFVGECYLSGAMHGEAFEGRDLTKPTIFTLV